MQRLLSKTAIPAAAGAARRRRLSCFADAALESALPTQAVQAPARIRSRSIGCCVEHVASCRSCHKSHCRAPALCSSARPATRAPPPAQDPLSRPGCLQRSARAQHAYPVRFHAPANCALSEHPAPAGRGSSGLQAAQDCRLVKSCTSGARPMLTTQLHIHSATPSSQSCLPHTGQLQSPTHLLWGGSNPGHH